MEAALSVKQLLPPRKADEKQLDFYQKVFLQMSYIVRSKMLRI